MSAASRTAPDGEEWKQLYRQHRGTMYRVAVAALRGARRADVDALDIVSESFSSVMRNPPQEVTSWEALLVRVTKLRAIDYLKSAEHTNGQLARSTEDGQPQIVGPLPSEDPAEVVIRRASAQSIRERLVRQINTLPAQQRRVLTQRIFESKTNAEIAAMLGTTSANVSQLLKKGLSQVVEILAELDGVDATVLEGLRGTRRAGGAP